MEDYKLSLYIERDYYDGNDHGDGNSNVMVMVTNDVQRYSRSVCLTFLFMDVCSFHMLFQTQLVVTAKLMSIGILKLLEGPLLSWSFASYHL
jgi:hypothetical protein